jgi:hypothetical protein
LRTPPLPKLFFVRVATTADEGVFEMDHLDSRRVVVVVVEAFDDLERPTALEDVTADDIAPQRCRLAPAARGGEADRALFEQEISAADELVERVEMTTSSFHVFQCFGGLADRVDRRVVARRVWWLGHRIPPRGRVMRS